MIFHLPLGITLAAAMQGWKSGRDSTDYNGKSEVAIAIEESRENAE
jgi:hypothetical protein